VAHALKWFREGTGGHAQSSGDVFSTTEEPGVVHMATRNGDQTVRPWEWEVLEAIRLDSDLMVQAAAKDSLANWDVTVGRTYANSHDKAHLYYLVRSFGGLQWKVGQTLAQTAWLNKRFRAAAAIEQAAAASKQPIAEEASTTTEEAGVIRAATRLGDRSVRPWEWQLLEAIRLNSGPMVHAAAKDPHLNWDVRVGSYYANAHDTAHLYYLVRSFGSLQWKVGDTLAQTAMRNDRLKAFEAMEQEFAQAKEQKVEQILA
jgi:hypothetical protein